MGTSACTANFLGSDKDILAINGNAVSYPAGSGLPQACGSTDPLPANTNLNVGDKLKFQLNLCNNGTGAASGIAVTDNMTNLVMPAGYTDFNASYNGSSLTYDTANSNTGSSCTPHAPQGDTNYYCSFGTIPNQGLQFSLPGTISAGSLPNITYEAQVSIPSGTSQVISRFQNSFSIKYNGNLTTSGSTPWLPFYTGKAVPTINEVP
jgi:hypothetical protein